MSNDKSQDKLKKATKPSSALEAVEKITVSSAATDKKVEAFLKKINKKYDNDDEEGNAIGIGHASEMIIKTIPIPTPFESFNLAAGGGMPNNGVVEIFGEESIGKTWIALCTLAQAQKLIPDRRAVLCDLEGSSDPDRLKFAGVDLDKLYMVEPCMGELLFEKLEQMIESELFSAILVDSIPALQPKAIFEGEIGDKNFGPIAALLSDALRKIAPKCRKHRVLLMMINQTRQNIGASMFEEQNVTTGGRAIKFYSHMRIKLSKFYDKSKKVKFDISDATGNRIGHRVTAKFIKNRYSGPFKEGMFEVLYQEPDLALEVIKQAKKAGLWKIHSGNYKYTGLDGNLVIGSNEEDFIRRIVIQNKLIELANRLFEAQKETTDQYLPLNFDMAKLILIQETEQRKYKFIGSATAEVEELDPDQFQKQEEICE